MWTLALALGCAPEPVPGPHSIKDALPDGAPGEPMRALRFLIDHLDEPTSSVDVRSLTGRQEPRPHTTEHALQGLVRARMWSDLHPSVLCAQPSRMLPAGDVEGMVGLVDMSDDEGCTLVLQRDTPTPELGAVRFGWTVALAVSGTAWLDAHDHWDLSDVQIAHPRLQWTEWRVPPPTGTAVKWMTVERIVHHEAEGDPTPAPACFAAGAWHTEVGQAVGRACPSVRSNPDLGAVLRPDGTVTDVQLFNHRHADDATDRCIRDALASLALGPTGCAAIPLQLPL